MLKPKKEILQYQVKKHLTGGFYIVEIYKYSNENTARKRKLKAFRNLTLTEAENAIYKLEKNKSKMKPFFFKTEKTERGLKLKPLAGQTFDDGKPVNCGLNVSADHETRNQYPVGTVFASLTCDLSTYRGTYFYKVNSKLWTMLPQAQLKDLNHKAPDSIWLAYEDYVDNSTAKQEVKTTAETKSFYTRMLGNQSLTPPKIEDSGFLIDKDNWYLTIRNINNGINTMFVGATGTGKTEFIRLLCKHIGKELCIYDMGSMLDPIAGLLGTHRLVDGGSVFDYSRFTEDIQKPCVILLDELSRAPVTANNILFPVLDNRRELPVEIAGGKDMRRIKVHPDCVFLATANIGAEYTGTSTLDTALVNRFFTVEMKPLDEAQEATVLEEKTGIAKDQARCIAKIATLIRKMYQEQNLSTSVSIRETLMVAELVADGWDLVKSLSLVFLPKYEGTISEGERSVVYKLFMSR